MMPIKRKIAENGRVGAATREHVYGEDNEHGEGLAIVARVKTMIDRINNPDHLDRAVMEMPYDDIRERLGMERVGGEMGNGTYEDWLKSRLERAGWTDQVLKKMTPHVFMTPRERTTGEQDVKAARKWLESRVKNLILAPGGNRP